MTTANFTNWDQHLNYWLLSGPGGAGGLQTQVTGLSLGPHWNLFFPETYLFWDGELAPGSWLLALLSISSLGDLWLCPLAVSQYLLSHSMSHCQVLFKEFILPRGRRWWGIRERGARSPWDRDLFWGP